jgi:ribonuclease R
MSSKNSDGPSVGNDPFGTREQAKYEQPIASREFITSVLLAEKGPMDLEALAEKLGLSDNPDSAEALRRRVGAMLRDGQLIQNRRRGLVPVDTEALVAGRISAHPDGFGFVNTEDGDKDVYLSGEQMRQVLHGDRVVVSITGTDRKGRREGRIVDVVERANKSLVGRLSIDRGTVVVLPDNKRIHQNLLITPGELGDAVDGDMVVAEIVEQPTRTNQPVGRIAEVLGQHLRPGMEIDVALHSHGIPAEWPDAVLDEAAAFSPTVDNTLSNDRNDVRTLPLITIDGADARDFDDAVWCERLDEGWRLIVAIADVAHYVSPGSALDKEAVGRGTSVYFPGRVVPMLPEVLSNGLCSLNPEVDRLCMMCELTLDENANVAKTRFHNGIMRSHARLTYDQVSEMLTDTGSELREKYASVLPMIEELHNLYKALAKKRRKRGAIEFDSNETHIIFDENKKIKEIIPIQRNDAHKLIEECMILANIEAAAFLEEQDVPVLYRVHAGPKSDRLEDLRTFLALRSLTLGGGDMPSALDYAALAEQITERVDRSVIQTVMLRSMQQAVYQPKNEGHFGLALNEYAHFTSPIRRYPDLLVHRAIKFALKKEKVSSYLYSKEAMVALGESCSMTERRAEDASRDVVAWLKCEYMQDHVGSDFPGVVTAVTSFGLFVELVGIHVEGLVHITNLSHDYYRFEQAAHTLVGERTGTLYQLGDAIVVKVAAVNLEDRKIDFTEVSHHAEVATRSQAPKHSKSIGEQANSQGKKRKSKKQRLRDAVLQAQQAKTASGDPQGAPEGNSQAAPVAQNAKQKIQSAEQKRQNKRRLKQRRRNEKRASAKEAQRLESLRTESNKESGQSDVSAKVATDSAVKTSNAVPNKAGPVVAKKVAQKADAGVIQPVSEKAPAVVAKKVAKKTSAVLAKKVANKASASAAEKITEKASSVVAKKVVKKTIAVVSKKVAKKASSVVAKKVAKKSSPVAVKKIAKKVSSVVAKKITKKANPVAAKKIAKKLSSVVAKKIAKKANPVAAKKVAKKANPVVTKKIAKKVSSVVAKKIAKKANPVAARKVAKKANPVVTKKIAKKVNSVVAKKIAKKANPVAAKKVAKKTSSAVAKKSAKKLSKTAVAKKAMKKTHSKVAQKASKKGGAAQANKIVKKANAALAKKSGAAANKKASKKPVAGIAKKAAAKITKPSAKKVQTKVAKAASNKPPAKVTKKVAKKSVEKTVKKTANKVANRADRKVSKKAVAKRRG